MADEPIPAQAPAPAPPDADALRPETSRERLQRRVHQFRLYTRVVLLVAAGVILIALLAANTRQVRLSWVVGDTTASLVWIMLVSALLGWVLGNATSFLVRRSLRRRVERTLAVSDEGDEPSARG